MPANRMRVVQPEKVDPGCLFNAVASFPDPHRPGSAFGADRGEKIVTDRTRKRVVRPGQVDTGCLFDAVETFPDLESRRPGSGSDAGRGGKIVIDRTRKRVVEPGKVVIGCLLAAVGRREVPENPAGAYAWLYSCSAAFPVHSSCRFVEDRAMGCTPQGRAQQRARLVVVYQAHCDATVGASRAGASSETISSIGA